ncbi:MAG: adenylate/guanylate cyclase domain-containing protein [Deltaproteobacteria bacterium]|nr:adenylate/guanylate cyclase domain-containing protein [Deltaproteobacteria bacterium]
MKPVRAIRPGDRTVFLLLAASCAALTLLAYLYRPAFLTLLDLKASDAMLSVRGSSTAPKEVVIAAIDEKSVNELGRWPWSREVTAGLITVLKPARVTALDIVFSEKQNAAADGALARAVESSGNVVLGYFFRDDSTEQPSEAALSQIKTSSINLINIVGGQAAGDRPFPGPELSGVETNIDVIGRGGAGFGSFNADPQDDGIYRTANLVYKYGGDLYPSLPLEALHRYLGGDVMLNAAPFGIDGVTVGDRGIPVDEQGAFTLNFYGGGGAFATYSAVDLIKGRVSAGAIKDKLVFVGVTERAIYDIRPTPVDAYFPGVEIHATVAGNVLQGRYLIHDARVVVLDLALVFVLPLALAAIIGLAPRTYISLAAGLCILAALIAFDYYLFARRGVKPDAVYPGLSLILAYLSCEAYRNVVVEKKGRYLKKAFSQYVSPDLVSEIIRDPDRLKLGGEKRVVTVLFSDIRGFTTISEKLPPDELVTLLNEYLSPMTRIVLDEKGLLDKYIGDAIMAIFNAPLTIPDHPMRACAAAAKMMPRLEELNAGWARKGYPAIKIGVGVNTGEAVVGNMGAELRFDYTGIGDTVNLASRLEGLNKLYGTRIIVSEFTYEQVKDAFLFRELDLVRVKGKAKPVGLYELTGGTDRDRGICAAFAEALALYRAWRFEDARKKFALLLERLPDDGPSKLYLTRCDEFLATPPPPDWDGVYVAKTK